MRFLIIFFADSLAPSFLQTLESCLKRNKLICTSESESKDQIGDSCTIFVTIVRNDAKKFCLTNKECFQANKTAVNPSKICCKSTIAIVFDRHPQKNLSSVFVMLWKFSASKAKSHGFKCLSPAPRRLVRPRNCQLCKSPDNFGKTQLRQSLIILASNLFCSMMANKHLWLNPTPNFVIPRFGCRTHNSVRISDFLKDHPNNLGIL